MIRVRYPNGTTVQYNSANHLKYFDYAWELYTKKDGDLVAIIQAGAAVIVEFVLASRIYNALADAEGERFSRIEANIEAMRRKLSKLSTADRKRRRK